MEKRYRNKIIIIITEILLTMEKTGQNPTDNGQDRTKPYRQWTRQDKTLQTMDKTG